MSFLLSGDPRGADSRSPQPLLTNDITEQLAVYARRRAPSLMRKAEPRISQPSMFQRFLRMHNDESSCENQFVVLQ